MTLLVYVDASFRGRHDMASGIAAMLVSDGHVRGRTALAIKARDSHHAETMAIILGLTMATMVPDVKLIIVHSDSEGLVKQVARGRIGDIKKMIAQARDNGIDVQVVHVPRSHLSMTHVDYLSKTITTE